MERVLLDGSNISLHGARTGKLERLDTLGRVINCLLANSVVPYTIFDASFRWHLADNSAAFTDFRKLTKGIPEHFQMSPSGEKADLFLLETAHTADFPVLSNDTFKEFGGAKDGILKYKGKNLSIFNFQVFAGVVVIPDLEIRRAIEANDGSLQDFEKKVFALDAETQAAQEPPALATTDERDSPVSSGDSDAVPDEDVALDPGKLVAISKVIDKYVSEGNKSVATLAGRLRDHRVSFQESACIGKKNPRRWFGYPNLDDFIRARLPHFRVKDGKIDRPD
jgi:hypothetical protein